MGPRTARGMAKNSGVSSIVRLSGIHHLENVSRWVYPDCHNECYLLNQTEKCLNDFIANNNGSWLHDVPAENKPACLTIN